MPRAPESRDREVELDERIDPSTLRWTILGCGAVGSAFAAELAPRAEVRLWSRRAEGAAALAARLEPDARDRGVHAVRELGEAVAGADAVLLAVTDDAIAEVAARTAEACVASGDSASRVALHHAGYFGPEPLEPLARAGWSTGKLHPLAAMPPGGALHGVLQGALHGVWFAVAGANRARAVASSVVRLVGGHELALRAGAEAEASRTYHAAAALLAGGVVALMDASEEVFATALEDPSRARPALLALLESAIRPLAALGPEGALAGPASRGSVDVVAGHLEALRARDPRVATLYARLAERMAALALARGTVDADRRAALERILRDE